MKTRMGKKFKRAITVLMSAVLIAETVNCANLTAFASEGSVSAGDNIVMDSELRDLVDAAENADKAAYEAAAAAEEARKAAEDLAKKSAEAALETDSEGNYTETVSDGNGNSVEQPVLKEELDAKITDAEQKVDEANTNTDNVQQTTESALADVVADAETDTAEKLADATAAAADAETAKAEAEQAAKAAKNAGDQFAAEKQAKKAQEAADKAKAAADVAKAAYEESVDILNAAIEEYNRIVAAAEAAVAAGTADAQTAINDAQAALDAAKAAVEAAKAEYDAALANSLTAQAAAKEAADQAGLAKAAAADTIAKLEEAKNVDHESLKAEKAGKEAELQQAQEDKEKIDAAQDQIIQAEQVKKDAADAKIAEYDQAKSRVEELEDRGVLGVGRSDISKAREVASKTTDDWKVWPLSKYTQSEIDAAKAIVAEYEAAKALVNNTDIATFRQESATAQNNIADAQQKKADAANKVNGLTTDIAALAASIATITDYIYSNENAEVTCLDKEKQAEYKKLLDEFGDSFDAYTEVKEDTDKYIEATKDPGFWKWLGGIFTGDTWKKWFDELDLETKYHGWTTKDGTYIVIKNDKDNTQALIAIRDDKAYIASVDEAEFAVYSATFDKVAASQAATKAAEAAQAESASLKKYNAAMEALAAAQARLDAAKLKKLDLDEAQKALAEAQKNVDETKLKWEEAQKAADEAQKAADEAKQAVETKPVKAAFYILNRGLTQPAEVRSYPAANYSKKIVGELCADSSYISLYKKGIKDSAVIPQYIKTAPTTEQLANIGVVLKEGEYITWYVIKTETDGYHVDGFISNQRFNIEVQYGYYDADNNFVEITKEDGTTYAQSGVFGLDEKYSFTSPVIEDYNAAETAVVSGTATKDQVIRVEYTKEATKPVVINYFRGGLNGTLLATSSLDVAESKLADYADTINAKWIDAYRPGDCSNGVLVNYYYDDASSSWSANVVYNVIPTGNGETTVVLPTPTPAPAGEEAQIVVAEEEEQEVLGAVAPIVPAVTEEVVTVEEEETPLAPAVPEEDKKDDGAVEAAGRVTDIEEEATPLAAPAAGCQIHWLILLLTAAYTAYELVRGIRRNKQIKELETREQNAEA